MSFADDLHKPGSRSPIEHETLLVVEGYDTFRFLLRILHELKLEQQIELRNFGGVKELPNFLTTLRLISGFHVVRSLGVVRDCEGDPAAAFQSVCSALSNARFVVPSAPFQIAGNDLQTSVMLLPDAKTPGMLETLCWRSLANNPIVPCVDEFLTCIESATGSAISNPDKSRIYAYISGQDQPNLLLGQAVHAGYFPLDSPAFDEVKVFRLSLVVQSH